MTAFKEIVVIGIPPVFSQGTNPKTFSMPAQVWDLLLKMGEHYMPGLKKHLKAPPFTNGDLYALVEILKDASSAALQFEQNQNKYVRDPELEGSVFDKIYSDPKKAYEFCEELETLLGSEMTDQLKPLDSSFVDAFSTAFLKFIETPSTDGREIFNYKLG